MKLIRLANHGQSKLGVRYGDSVLFLENIPGFVAFDNLIQLMRSSQFEKLHQWHKESNIRDFEESMEPIANYSPVKLIDRPQKIIGIGLNYLEHASDLTDDLPKDFPTIFIKPSTVLIGHHEFVKIPKLSQRTTGEAELGIIYKQDTKDAKNWLDVIAGFVAIVDMTAEDILRQNARYLGLSKIFDSFLSLGCELITPDEFENIADIEVATVINGNIHAKNVIGNMRFSPQYLVEFLSSVMSIQTGDIISTGTPRAVEIAHDDRIECRITGFQPLINPVNDLKKS